MPNSNNKCPEISENQQTAFRAKKLKIQILMQVVAFLLSIGRLEINQFQYKFTGRN